MRQQALRVNSPQVMYETIDGEVIVIHLGSGNYYCIRDTGVSVWELVERNQSTDEIVAALAARFDDPRERIEAGVAGFIRELQEEDLVAAADGAVAANSTPEKTPTILASAGGLTVFEAPTLEKYTDMQDLVLIDPVHQVEDKGWPYTQPEIAKSS